MYRTLYGNRDRDRIETQIAMELKSKIFDTQLVQTVLSVAHLWSSVALIYGERKEGKSKPKGSVVNGRWLPDPTEKCPYCEKIIKLRKPIRRHCNTKKHIASSLCLNMLEENAKVIYDAVASVVQRNKRPTPNEALLVHHFGLFLEQFTVQVVHRDDER